MNILSPIKNICVGIIIIYGLLAIDHITSEPILEYGILIWELYIANSFIQLE